MTAGRFARAGALALCAGAALPASALELAVLAADDAGLRSRIETRLLSAGWTIAREDALAHAPDVRLLTARTRDPAAERRLFAVASDLETSLGVRAGELVRRDPTGFQLYGGRVLVRLARAGDSTLLQSWALQMRFANPRFLRDEQYAVLDARSPHADVLARLQPLTQGILAATPLLSRGRLGGPPAPVAKGGFHTIPGERNELGAIRADGVVESDFLDAIAAAGGVVEETVRGVVFATFAGDPAVPGSPEQDMQNAIVALRPLSRVVGPSVRRDPPRLLTNRLIVRHESLADTLAAEAVLDAGYGLEPLYEVPYAPWTVVYARSEPSFVLYDAAKLLLEEGAKLALPDTWFELRPAAPPPAPPSAPPPPDGVDCAIADYPAYLTDIGAPEAWESWTTKKRGSGQHVALLDDGFASASPFCEKMRVRDILAHESPSDETPADLTSLRCTPTDVDDWCGTGCGGLSIDGAHGTPVALAAAARHVDPSPEPSCDTPRGTVDGAPSILVRGEDFDHETFLAGALVWSAGIDPGHDEFGDPPGAGLAASTLNLSFHAAYASPETCTGGTDGICAAVCTADTTCGLLETALQRLHEADKVVLAARAHNAKKSDLDRSRWTLAVGSAQADGDPTGPSGFLLHEPTDDDTLTAPMGYEVSIGGGVRTGHSSAATAVASGVVTMMLDVAPGLTAEQVHCILTSTAESFDLGDGWNTELKDARYCREDSAAACAADENCDVAIHCPAASSPVCAEAVPGTIFAGADPACRWETDCGFVAGHSRCVGHGRIDADAAVRAAAACDEPSDLAIHLTRPRTVNMRRERPQALGPVDLSDYVLVLNLEPVLEEEAVVCPCDEDGDPVLYAASGPVLLAMAYVPADGNRVPSAALETLACIDEGRCVCPPGDPDCLGLAIANPTERTLKGARLRARSAGEAWNLRLRAGPWGPDERMLVPIPRDVGRRWLERWRETGELPELELRRVRFLPPRR